MSKASDNLSKGAEDEIKDLNRRNRCYIHPRRLGVVWHNLMIKRMVGRRVRLCERCARERGLK